MIWIILLSSILMLIGLLGVFVPIVPDAPLAWLGLFVYAYGSHFAHISKTAVLVFFILSVVSISLEFILPLFGAKAYKASKQGIIGAAIGLLIGPFVLNFLGIILGPLIGAIIGEWIAGKGEKSFRAGWGVFMEFMLSLALKLVLTLVMLGYFIFAVAR